MCYVYLDNGDDVTLLISKRYVLSCPIIENGNNGHTCVGNINSLQKGFPHKHWQQVITVLSHVSKAAQGQTTAS